MKMKRFLLPLIVLMMLWNPVGVHAAQIDESLLNGLNDYLESSGAQELSEELPPEARHLLEELELGKIDIGKLLSLTPGDFVRVIRNTAESAVLRPARVFGTMMGVMILVTLVGALYPGKIRNSTALSSVFSTVSILCIAAVIVDPITECILDSAQALHDCSSFMIAFIPVFISIITVSGSPVTATSYHAFLFGACQLISAASSNVLIPFMGIYTGLSVAGSVGEDIGVLPLAKGIRSFVTWSLTLMMTIYVTLLSMQTLISTGTDSVLMKTGKFLIGSFVPIVGSAISDALATAQGAVHLLKTTVGTFGIAAGAAIFLPIVIRVAVWYGMLKIASFTAGVLSHEKIKSMLEACGNCLGVMLAVLAAFLLLIIVSLVLLLNLSSAGTA